MNDGMNKRCKQFLSLICNVNSHETKQSKSSLTYFPSFSVILRISSIKK